MNKQDRKGAAEMFRILGLAGVVMAFILAVVCGYYFNMESMGMQSLFAGMLGLYSLMFAGLSLCCAYEIQKEGE